MIKFNPKTHKVGPTTFEALGFDNIKIFPCWISPEIAQKWYSEDNASNQRSVSRRNVDYLVEEIKKNWYFTGEPIIIDYEGKLRNGQHTLLAIIKAGIPALKLVVQGVEPEAFKAMDQGKKRNINDVFQIEFGEKKKWVKQRGCLASKWIKFHEGNHAISPNKALEWEHRQDLKDSFFSEAWNWYDKSSKILSQTSIAFLRKLLLEKGADPIQVRNFMNDVFIAPKATTQAMKLARQLRKVKIERKTTGVNYESIDKEAWVILAWNSMQRPGSRLSFKYSVQESGFPEILLPELETV